MSITDLLEARTLEQWLPQLESNPLQVNKRFESDCEFVKIDSTRFLATSCDSLDEEILLNLIDDPETLGWLCVTMTCSDLAAGATAPLGLLLNTVWGTDWNLEMKQSFAKGMTAALTAHGISLLGGDSGLSQKAVFSSTGLALTDKPILRSGAQIGDIVALTSPLSFGARLALEFIQNHKISKESQSTYRPLAPLEMMKNLRPYLRAAQDLSDGLFRTVDSLCAASQCEFRMNWGAGFYSDETLNYFNTHNTPIELAFFFEMAEYSSLCVIPSEKWNNATKENPTLLKIGAITHTDDPLKLDRTKFRKILDSSPADFQRKMTELSYHLKKAAIIYDR